MGSLIMQGDINTIKSLKMKGTSRTDIKAGMKDTPLELTLIEIGQLGASTEGIEFGGDGTRDEEVQGLNKILREMQMKDLEDEDK